MTIDNAFNTVRKRIMRIHGNSSECYINKFPIAALWITKIFKGQALSDHTDL